MSILSAIHLANALSHGDNDSPLKGAAVEGTLLAPVAARRSHEDGVIRHRHPRQEWECDGDCFRAVGQDVVDSLPYREGRCVESEPNTRGRP